MRKLTILTFILCLAFSVTAKADIPSDLAWNIAMTLGGTAVSDTYDIVTQAFDPTKGLNLNPYGQYSYLEWQQIYSDNEKYSNWLTASVYCTFTDNAYNYAFPRSTDTSWSSLYIGLRPNKWVDPRNTAKWRTFMNFLTTSPHNNEYKKALNTYMQCYYFGAKIIKNDPNRLILDWWGLDKNMDGNILPPDVYLSEGGDIDVSIKYLWSRQLALQEIYDTPLKPLPSAYNDFDVWWYNNADEFNATHHTTFSSDTDKQRFMMFSSTSSDITSTRGQTMLIIPNDKDVIADVQSFYTRLYLELEDVPMVVLRKDVYGEISAEYKTSTGTNAGNLLCASEILANFSEVNNASVLPRKFVSGTPSIVNPIPDLFSKAFQSPIFDAEHFDDELTSDKLVQISPTEQIPDFEDIVTKNPSPIDPTDGDKSMEFPSIIPVITPSGTIIPNINTPPVNVDANIQGSSNIVQAIAQIPFTIKTVLQPLIEPIGTSIVKGFEDVTSFIVPTSQMLDDLRVRCNNWVDSRFTWLPIEWGEPLEPNDVVANIYGDNVVVFDSSYIKDNIGAIRVALNLCLYVIVLPYMFGFYDRLFGGANNDNL